MCIFDIFVNTYVEYSYTGIVADVADVVVFFFVIIDCMYIICFVIIY